MCSSETCESLWNSAHATFPLLFSWNCISLAFQSVKNKMLFIRDNYVPIKWSKMKLEGFLFYFQNYIKFVILRFNISEIFKFKIRIIFCFWNRCKVWIVKPWGSYIIWTLTSSVPYKSPICIHGTCVSLTWMYFHFPVI